MGATKFRGNPFPKRRKLRLVDLRGVEPRTPPCHGGMLPLYHRPLFCDSIIKNLLSQ